MMFMTITMTVSVSMSMSVLVTMSMMAMPFAFRMRLFVLSSAFLFFWAGAWRRRWRTRFLKFSTAFKLNIISSAILFHDFPSFFIRSLLHKLFVLLLRTSKSFSHSVCNSFYSPLFIFLLFFMTVAMSISMSFMLWMRFISLSLAFLFNWTWRWFLFHSWTLKLYFISNAVFLNDLPTFFVDSLLNKLFVFLFWTSNSFSH